MFAKPAGRLATLAFDTFGFDGIYTPWKSIYVRETLIRDRELILHELAHAMQCRRDGFARFWFRITADYIIKGYANSRYEIEANEITAARMSRRS